MRGPGIALTAAVGGMLLVPAAPLADGPAVPPTAVLKGTPTTARVGAPVRLDSSGSRAGSGTIVGHVWDVDGNGSFERDSGARPRVTFTARDAGKLTVRVRVVDDLGQNGDAKLELAVVPRAKMENAQARPANAAEELPREAGNSGSGDTHAAPPKAPLAPLATSGVHTAPVLVPPRALSSHRVRAAAKKRRPARVTAAASNGVTIRNFKYSPATVSVHTGDTVTWTNQDQEPHTATANDGSFDTGNIIKGKSGSHTFSKAGTFSYICSIHPSMKGTVTVLGASSGGGNGGGSSGGGSSGGSGSSGSGSASSGSSSGGSGLPHTGLDIAIVILIAACLSGAGLSLRQAARRSG